jgi:4-amino-4-deoxy-L-arabinose transferase-like glycosyltransferase
MGLMGLMPQDAYYYFYSEHLDLSYYDHPGGIAWMLWFFTFLFGKKVFVVKLAATIVTLFTQVAFAILAMCFMDYKGTLQVILLLFSTVMISVLSLIATPDVPLLFFWTLCLIALYLAIFRGNNKCWLIAGILMGLAFNSKYTAVFLPLGLILFLILTPSYRKLFLSFWLYACLLLFIISTMPVVVWNYNHDFASFKFQSVGRVTEARGSYFNIQDFFGLIGHQSFLLVPVLFFTLITMLGTLFKMYRFKLSTIPAQKLFLLSFFAPVFIGFWFISFFYWVKINWMMPAYITGIILAGMYLKKKWLMYQLYCSLAIHLIMAVEIIFYPIMVRSDDTWVGWDQLARQVKEVKQHYPGYFIFSTDDYKTAAVLNFYFDEMVYSKNIIRERALQFDYVNVNLRALEGRNALFIDSHPDLSNCGAFPQILSKYFTQIIPVQPIVVKRGGKVVRVFCVYACMKYDSSGYYVSAK